MVFTLEVPPSTPNIVEANKQTGQATRLYHSKDETRATPLSIGPNVLYLLIAL